MRTRWLPICLLFLCTQALAADEQRGEGLYQNHCTLCHDSRLHIREQRKAFDAETLRDWVRRWKTHLALDWGESEVEDVAAYLNARFYKFKSSTTQ